MLKITKLNDQLTLDTGELTGNKVDVQHELNSFQSESKRLKNQMVSLHKSNRELLGKTNTFITEASLRVKNLSSTVIKKVKNNFLIFTSFAVLVKYFVVNTKAKFIYSGRRSLDGGNLSRATES